ncbi:hypothetical protein ACFQY5_22525 [Paeniroseomonas aquatica]
MNTMTRRAAIAALPILAAPAVLRAQAPGPAARSAWSSRSSPAGPPT